MKEFFKNRKKRKLDQQIDHYEAVYGQIVWEIDHLPSRPHYDPEVLRNQARRAWLTLNELRKQRNELGG
jgi:hypothetical protein